MDQREEQRRRILIGALPLWNIFPDEREGIKRRIELMARQFEGYPLDDFQQAVERCSLTCKRYPQASDIATALNEIIRDRNGGAMPTAPDPERPRIEHGDKHERPWSPLGLDRVFADVEAMRRDPKSHACASALISLGEAILERHGRERPSLKVVEGGKR